MIDNITPESGEYEYHSCQRFLNAVDLVPPPSPQKNEKENDLRDRDR